MMATKPTYKELEQRVKELEKEASEHKQTEKALRISENKFSKIFNLSPCPMGMSTLEDGIYTEINDSHLDLHGFNREEVIGKKSTEMGVYQDIEQRTVESIVGTVGQNFFDNVVASLCQWLGCDIAIVGEIVNDSSIKVLAMQVDGEITHDLQYLLADTPCENVTDKGFCHYPEEISALFPKDKDLREMGISGYVGIPLKDKHGRTIGILNALSRQKLEIPKRTEEVMNIIAAKAVSEIDRMRAEESLRESEEKYRHLVESTLDWVWACDVEGRQTFVNRAIKNLLGYEVDEIVGTSAFRLMPAEDKERVQRRFRKAVEHKRGWKGAAIRWQHKDGSIRFFETTAQPILDNEGNLIGFRGIDRDITERKQTEEEKKKLESQLQQAQKIESIGILAGGIAHDLNNILSSIMGYTEIALYDQLPEGSPARNSLDQVLKASHRAKNLVKQILAFNRQEE